MTDAERAFEEAMPDATINLRFGYTVEHMRAIWNARGAWDENVVEQTADDPVEQTRIIDAIRKGDV